MVYSGDDITPPTRSSPNIVKKWQMVYSVMVLPHQRVLYFRSTTFCTVQNVNLILFTA